VSGLDGGDPVGVTLEVADFLGNDGAFFSHHKFNIYYLILNSLIYCPGSYF
jgi:hypothetical protein